MLIKHVLPFNWRVTCMSYWKVQQWQVHTQRDDFPQTKPPNWGNGILPAPQNLILPFSNYLLPKGLLPYRLFLGSGGSFWISYKRNQTIYTLLGLASFPQTILLCVIIILSISLLINIPLCEYTTIFIHSVVEGHLSYFLFVLLQMYVLIMRAWEFQLLNILTNTWNCQSFCICSCGRYVRNLIVILICISQRTHAGENLFHISHLVFFFCEVPFQSIILFFFNLGYLSFYWFVGIIIYSGYKSFVGYMYWKHTFPVCYLFFIILMNRNS